MMSILPPSTNADYAGAKASAWFLALAGLLTLGPGVIHSILPDAGAHSIAGLALGDRPDVVIGVFRWQGATQIALALAMLAVAFRYRPLTPLFLALFMLEHGLMALQGWVLSPPVDGRHPPEHYGSLISLPLATVFLWLSLRRRPLA